jgi:hypothetical protein
MPIVLSISHNIFLTEKQRAQIDAREVVEAVGVSVPVWFFKGSTSEPASEVFCKYILTNIEEDYPIQATENGYKINLPQIPQDYKESNKPKSWNDFTPYKQSQWYKKHPTPLSSKNLIVEGILAFKRYNKSVEFGKKTTIVHSVEIRHMETLEASLS